MERPTIPKAQLWYGEIVYWICLASAFVCTVGPVVILWNADNNVMNPHYLFTAIFSGKKAAAIWNDVGGGFPGGHFYLKGIFRGDGLTQFGIALGCTSALPAALAAAYAYVAEKPKAWLWAGMACWVSFMIAFSAVSGGPPSH